MISRLRFICVLLLSSILISSCSDEGSRRRLPRFSGEPGEILVVMKESLWTGNEGDSLREVLAKKYPGLPQIEPSFKLLHFAPSEMSDLLRHHRNILRITIGADAEGENKVHYEKSKWANNQLYFRVRAKDEAAFYNLLNNDFQKIIQVINRTEINRIQEKYKAYGHERLEKKVNRKFGIDMVLPEDCELAVDTNDFMWIKRERIRYLGNTPHEITQGFFIFSYPYTTDSAFTPEQFLTVRDTVLEKFVPGPRKGTFMTTEYRLPPSSEVISLNDRYTVFTRGLWKMENYFMGGPFVALSTLSNDSSRVISVSGFVFAPRFDKREYIRDVEAIIKSVSFSENGN